MTMTRIQSGTCSHKDSLFLNVSREICSIVTRETAKVQLTQLFSGDKLIQHLHRLIMKDLLFKDSISEMQQNFQQELRYTSRRLV